MKISKLMLCGLLGGTVAGGCGITTTTAPRADGGSHEEGGLHAGSWSSVCLSDADCGSGLRCFCGLCTTPCTASSDCSTLSALATCPPSFMETSECDNSMFPGAGCAIVCTADSDCASLGTNSVCTGGFCKVPALVSYQDGGVVTCEDRTVEMTPKIAAVFSTADRSCKADSDCSTVELGNECYGDICTQVAVAATASASVGAQLSAIAGQYCGDFFEAGCAGPGLVHCAEEGRATCIGGTCAMNLQGVGTAAPTCDDRTAQIEQSLVYYERTPGESCMKDSDCAIQSLVSCEGGCGTLISKSGLDALAVGLTDIEQTLCVPFLDAGCHTLAPPCAFPGNPKCVANTCKTVIPGGPDSGSP